MIEIKQNVDLKPYNTFNISVKADFLVEVSSEQQIKEALAFAKDNGLAIFILNGGSNVLFLNDVKNKLIIVIRTKGINIIEEAEDYALVEVSAGENWHNFVLWSVSNSLAGIENLALIPGNTGSAPVQNIGAYGVEAKDVIEYIETLCIESGEKKCFSNQECKFGYRDSIFKNKEKEKHLITKVIFRLYSTINYRPKISYGNIKQELEKREIKKPTIEDIVNIVSDIRHSKLPDPKILGNCGSFFKNPIVSKDVFEKLLILFPDLNFFDIENPSEEKFKKVPAAFLIEKAGYKGFRRNDAGVHSKQALVLVNHGNATGREIFELAKEICTAIKDKFGVEIDIEVNIIE